MDIGTVRPVDINEEMRDSYLDYAMSVIVSRAIPDVRDGLKPVHRRILYAMYDTGIRANTGYKKSARIVGEVLGKYHPHSDSAVYDAMARMAQDFSMRYPLVDGQGNFGSVDGDSPAAMRYTEARMARIAEELLADIDKDTIDFSDNFDGTLQEPVVLPSRLPNLLLNGISGIAVGMATNIPPHNLNEVVAAVDYMIEQMIAPEGEIIDEELIDVTVEDLMQFVSGPDFPSGGQIVGTEGIVNAYATGRGRMVMRANVHVEEMRDGERHRIVVTEIPYQINKASVVEHIASLVRQGRLEMISDLRDESDRNGMSIVIELKRGAQPRTVINRLMKYTALQSTFGVQMLALVDGEPRILSLKLALRHFINHRREVIERRTLFDLARARRRAHILEGLLIAIGDLDGVIQLIRQSADAEEARDRLMTTYDLTEMQAQAILDMQLRRLAALERQKIEEEYAELQALIAELEDLLAHPKKVLALIREDLAELAETYGDERRTAIVVGDGEFDEADLVPDEDVLVFITQRGYIKRVVAEAYRTQGRGGKGVTGMTTREEDVVEHLFAAGSLDSILFFTDRGKVYQEKAYQIPDAGRAAKGMPLISVLQLDPDESVTAAVAVPDFDEVEYCTMVTRKGHIKRVEVAAFESVRPSGLIAISLAEGDELGWVKLTTGTQDLIIVTAHGRSIRFNEREVRSMGRNAAGVHAIKLRRGDEVAGADAIDERGGDLLIVTRNAIGKRTPLEEYPRRSRYGLGVLTLAHNQRTGDIIGARIVQPGDELTFITTGGMALRTTVDEISQIGRNTQGVQLMNLADGDSIASVALLEKDRRLKREQSLQAEHEALEAGLSDAQITAEAGPEGSGDGLDEANLSEDGRGNEETPLEP